jgi:hypothetical protein
VGGRQSRERWNENNPRALFASRALAQTVATEAELRLTVVVVANLQTLKLHSATQTESGS